MNLSITEIEILKLHNMNVLSVAFCYGVADLNKKGKIVKNYIE